MDAFEFSQLVEAQQKSGKLYLEFLRDPALSAGVYVLPAGQPDPQQPHSEDEVYYVVSGRGMIRVAVGVEHCFHSTTEKFVAAFHDRGSFHTCFQVSDL